MSEKRYKRFYVSGSENQLTIYDNEGLDDYYHLGNDERDVKGICKVLNEQQAIIEYLTIEKHQADKRFQTIIAELKKENEQLKEEIEPLKQKEEVLNKIWRTYLENHE